MNILKESTDSGSFSMLAQALEIGKGDVSWKTILDGELNPMGGTEETPVAKARMSPRFITNVSSDPWASIAVTSPMPPAWQTTIRIYCTEI